MVYLVQQEEVCPTTGRVHWQGFVAFDDTKRLSALKKLLPSAHFEPMRGSLDEAADYCCDPRKRAPGGLLLEDGKRPLYGDCARSASTTERYRQAYELAVKGQFEQIEHSMMIRHLGNILKLHTLFGKRPPDLPVPIPPGVWLVGGAGVGKTTLCAKFPHYKKDPRHRWFDGYQGEKTVVIDDFAPFHIAQTDILKQLGHQFAFQGETKGGSVWLRPHCVIITSQYMQLTCWEKDPESLAAIVRRYKVYNLPDESAEAEQYISERLYQTACAIALLSCTSDAVVDPTSTGPETCLIAAPSDASQAGNVPTSEEDVVQPVEELPATFEDVFTSRDGPFELDTQEMPITASSPMNSPPSTLQANRTLSSLYNHLFLSSQPTPTSETASTSTKSTE